MNEPSPAIYVHVPFCQTICGYCDFYSVRLDAGAVDPLVEALLTELDRAVAGRSWQARSIFVGGGTPTTLPAAALRRLLSRLRELADRDAEFTVEANPATVSAEIGETLVSCGVNRVSLGAQSFDTSELRVLDRIHRPEQVTETVSILRAAGIANLNLDLIFAIPGQSLRSWQTNLDAALALRPDHLSCYGLTYERGTPLFERLEAGEVVRADVELEAAMYECTIDSLERAGLAQYEISNFARPGFECRHNLVYWSNEPYLGIGPSASGYVDGERYKNIPDAAEYARAVAAGRRPTVHAERLPIAEQARETAMLALRLNAGLSRERFRTRYGADPAAHFAEAVRRHESLGFLEVTDSAIRLTQRGRLVADAVARDFL